MNTNFSDFIEPISPAQPAGENIEYDARFINIQNIAEGKPEQQYGDVIIEAEKPDWNSVEKLCRQLLSESKDLRVFCFYTQALTANHGINGFNTGCTIIHTNLEKYWDDLYPTLLDEDELDPFYRMNAISLLLSEDGVLKQLYEANILYLPNKKLSLTLKMVISILNNNDQSLYLGGKDKLIQDLKVAYESEKEELLNLKNALNAIEEIENIFTDKIKDDVLDFSTIKQPLQFVSSFLNDRAVSNDQEVAQSDDNDIIETAKPDNRAIHYDLTGLKISDRNDVNIVLDKLILYFRLKEPSHPAPLFIGRLQKLMDMDFYQIMKDISPNSLSELDMIIGKESDSESVSETDE